MPEVELPQFECSECGRLFRWTHKLSGKVVRCPCGAVMNCPDHPTFGAEPILEAIPLDPVPRPAAASQAIAEEPPKAEKVAVRRVASPDASPKLVEPGVIRDLYMPLAFLAFGILVEGIHVALAGSASVDVLWDLAETTGLQAALIIVGIFAAGWIRHFSLGPFPTAVLKVVSITVAVPAAIVIIGPITSKMCFGYLLDAGAALFCYFTLLGTLFDLEEQDTFDCIGVIFFIYAGVFVLNKFVLQKH